MKMRTTIRIDHEEGDPKVRDLLKCTLKKSKSVLAKVVLLAAYGVVGLTVAAIAGYALFIALTIGAPIASDCAGVLSGVLGSIILAIVSIPWYYYAIVIAVLAIPGYSLIWCMARELTEEDWESDTAENIAPAISFALAIALSLVLTALALALAFAPALAIALSLPALALATLAFALSLALSLALALAEKPSIWYHIFRFPGAYLHYRKRIRSEKP